MLKGLKRKADDLSKAIMWLINIAETRLNNRKAVGGYSAVGIVRLDAIGDFVLWSDTLEVYRNLYPDCEIILFCNSLYYDLTQFFSEIDRVVPIEMKRYRRLEHLWFHFKTRSQLKQYKVDTLIHPTYSRNVYMDSIAAAIPAHKKIAADGEASNSSKLVKKINDVIYNRLLETPSSAVMEMERNKYFIHGLGGTEYKSGYSLFPSMPSSYNFYDKYFVVYLGGSCVNKYWPIESYAKVSAYVHKKYAWKCCLIGMDNNLKQQFMENLQFAKENIIDLVGKTSLVDVACIIQRAELLLGNDTSGVHFAVASKVPSVTVGGGWEYQRFLPYVADNPLIGRIQKTACCKMECFNCRYTRKIVECIEAEASAVPYLCISNVTVEEVIKLIDEIEFKDKLNEYID